MKLFRADRVFSILLTALLAQSVAAEEWKLPFDRPICSDCFHISPDGATLVCVERAAEQPADIKGPPRPENGDLQAFTFASGKAKWFGGRDTSQSGWPDHGLPAPGGRFIAALVFQLDDPASPVSKWRPSLFITDLKKEKSKQIADDVARFVWDPADASLLVSYTRDDDTNTRAVRRYDPLADSWTETGVYGVCYAVSQDGGKALYRVNLDSIKTARSLLSKTPPREGLAVLDRNGRLLRDFGLVDQLSGAPCMSPSGSYVASARSLLNVAPERGSSVVVLSVETGARSEVPGVHCLVGVTDGGIAVTLQEGEGIARGRRLQKVLRSGRIETLADNVVAAAFRGPADVCVVTTDRPSVVQSVNVVTPKSLFADADEDSNPPVMSDQEYLDSISFDNYLNELQGIDDSTGPTGSQIEPSGQVALGAYELSEQQREVNRRLGSPSLFTIRFLEETVDDLTIRCRSETWIYPAARSSFEFLDGECIAAKPLEARDYPRSVIRYKPSQFTRGMTPGAVKHALMLSELTPIRLADRGVRHADLQRISVFSSHDLLLGFADDRLVSVQCLPRVLPKP